MALDEYGREPGVDYSSQSWSVLGYTFVDEAIAREMSALDSQHDAVEIAALVDEYAV